MHNSPSLRSWRRYIPRLSLRALMILVSSLGAGLGYFILRARDQGEAVVAIQRAGGTIVYDWQWKNGDRDPFGKPGLPDWLLNRLRPDHFYRVKEVVLSGGDGDRADDDLMGYIGRLDDLERLNLNGCKDVTDAGLAHLRRLSELRDLDLTFTGATGAGLKNLEHLTQLVRLNLTGLTSDADLASLKGFTKLRYLQLCDTSPAITDEGLDHLRGLVNLETLSISSPRITSAGLKSLHNMARLSELFLNHTGVADLRPIRHMTGLKWLSLWSSPIDDAGLAPIADLTGMQNLTLSGTQITDAGLESIQYLRSLTHLDLDATRITDAGLDHLAGLTNLQNLRMSHTSVSDSGLSRLAGLNKINLLFLEATLVWTT